MKNVLTLVIALLMAPLLNAQFDFKTGDAELDSDLNTINTQAKTDLTAFKADLSATFGVSTKNIDYMVSIKMEPGEMYFALELSKTINKPIEEVLDVYEANRDKGWGYIAQQMGIKPGSPEFHALKGNAKSKKDKVAKGNSGASNNNGNGNGNSQGKRPQGSKK